VTIPADSATNPRAMYRAAEVHMQIGFRNATDELGRDRFAHINSPIPE
jgi:hypothetical protein